MDPGKVMLRVIRFGKLDYPCALALQSKLVAQKLLNRSNEPDYLILLEHEACVTLGRRSHADIPNTNVPVIKVKTPKLSFSI